MQYHKLNGNLIDNELLEHGGVIVHGCNAQGAMGSGVALFVKTKWPVVFDDYRDMHKRYGLETGDVIYSHVEDNMFVANAITQEYYRGCKHGPKLDVYVDYEAITKCFQDIVDFFDDHPEIEKNLHMPMIGAGLAGGNWNEIETRITETLKDTDINLYLWIYN